MESLRAELEELARNPSHENNGLRIFSSAVKLLETLGVEEKVDESHIGWRNRFRHGDTVYAYHNILRHWRKAIVHRIEAEHIEVSFRPGDSHFYHKHSGLLNATLPDICHQNSWRVMLRSGFRCDVFVDGLWTEGLIRKVQPNSFLVEVNHQLIEMPFLSVDIAEYRTMSVNSPRFRLREEARPSRDHLLACVPDVVKGLSKCFVEAGGLESLQKHLNISEFNDSTEEFAFLVGEALANGLLSHIEDTELFSSRLENLAHCIVKHVRADRFFISIPSLEIFLLRSNAASHHTLTAFVEAHTLEATAFILMKRDSSDREVRSAVKILLDACEVIAREPRDKEKTLSDIESTEFSEEFAEKPSYMVSFNFFSKFLAETAALERALEFPDLFKPKIQSVCEFIAHNEWGRDVALMAFQKLNITTLLGSVQPSSLADHILDVSKPMDVKLLEACLNSLRLAAELDDKENSMFWFESPVMLKAVLARARICARNYDALSRVLEATHGTRGSEEARASISRVAQWMFDTSLVVGDLAFALTCINFVIKVKKHVKLDMITRIGRAIEIPGQNVSVLLDILLVILRSKSLKWHDLRELLSTRQAAQLEQQPYFDKFLAQTISLAIRGEEYGPDTKRVQALQILGAFCGRNILNSTLSVGLRLKCFDLFNAITDNDRLNAEPSLERALDLLFGGLLEDDAMENLCIFIFRYELFGPTLDRIDEEWANHKTACILLLARLFDLSDSGGTRGNRSHISRCSTWHSLAVKVTFPSDLPAGIPEKYEPSPLQSTRFLMFGTKSCATVWDVKTQICKRLNLFSPQTIGVQIGGEIILDGARNGATLTDILGEDAIKSDSDKQWLCEVFSVLPAAGTREVLLQAIYPPKLSRKATRAFLEVFDKFSEQNYLSVHQFAQLSGRITGKPFTLEQVNKIFAEQKVQQPTHGMTREEFIAFYANLASRKPANVWSDLAKLGYNPDFAGPEMRTGDELSFNGEDAASTMLQSSRRISLQRRSHFGSGHQSLQSIIVRTDFRGALASNHDSIYSKLWVSLEDDNEISEQAWAVLMRAPTRPNFLLELETCPHEVYKQCICQKQTIYLIQSAKFLLTANAVFEDAKRRILQILAYIYIKNDASDIRRAVTDILLEKMKSLPQNDGFWSSYESVNLAKCLWSDLVASASTNIELILQMLPNIPTDIAASLISRDQIIKLVTLSSEATIKPSDFAHIVSICVGLSERQTETSIAVEARLACEDLMLPRMKLSPEGLRHAFRLVSSFVQHIPANLLKRWTERAIETADPLSLEASVCIAHGLHTLLRTVRYKASERLFETWLASEGAISDADQTVIINALIDNSPEVLERMLKTRVLAHLNRHTVEDPSKDFSKDAPKVFSYRDPEVVASLLLLSAADDVLRFVSSSNVVANALDMFLNGPRRRISLSTPVCKELIGGEMSEEAISQAQREISSYEVRVRHRCEECGKTQEALEQHSGPLRFSSKTAKSLDFAFSQYQEEANSLEPCAHCQSMGRVRRSVQVTQSFTGSLLVEFRPTKFKTFILPLLDELENKSDSGSHAKPLESLGGGPWFARALWFKHRNGMITVCVRNFARFESDSVDVADSWLKYSCSQHHTTVIATSPSAIRREVMEGNVAMQSILLSVESDHVPVVSSESLSKLCKKDHANWKEWSRLCSKPVAKFYAELAHQKCDLALASESAFLFTLLARNVDNVFGMVFPRWTNVEGKNMFESLSERVYDMVGNWIAETECGDNLNLVLTSLKSKRVPRYLMLSKRFHCLAHLLDMQMAPDLSLINVHEEIDSLVDSDDQGSIWLLVRLIELQGQKKDVQNILETIATNHHRSNTLCRKIQYARADVQKRACHAMAHTLVKIFAGFMRSTPENPLKMFSLEMLRRYFPLSEILKYLDSLFRRELDVDEIRRVLDAIFSPFIPIEADISKEDKLELANVLLKNERSLLSVLKDVVDQARDHGGNAFSLISKLIRFATELYRKSLISERAPSERLLYLLGTLVLRNYWSFPIEENYGFYKPSSRWLDILFEDITPMYGGPSFEAEILRQAHEKREIDYIRVLMLLDLLACRMNGKTDESDDVLRTLAHLPVPEQEDRATDWVLRFLQRFPSKDPEGHFVDFAMDTLLDWASLENRMDVIAQRFTVRYPHEPADVLVKYATSTEIFTLGDESVQLHVLHTKDNMSLLFWATNSSQSNCRVYLAFTEHFATFCGVGTSDHCHRALLPGESGLVFEAMLPGIAECFDSIIPDDFVVDPTRYVTWRHLPEEPGYRFTTALDGISNSSIARSRASQSTGSRPSVTQLTRATDSSSFACSFPINRRRTTSSTVHDEMKMPSQVRTIQEENGMEEPSAFDSAAPEYGHQDCEFANAELSAIGPAIRFSEDQDFNIRTEYDKEQPFAIRLSSLSGSGFDDFRENDADVKNTGLFDSSSDHDENDENDYASRYNFELSKISERSIAKHGTRTTEGDRHALQERSMNDSLINYL